MLSGFLILLAVGPLLLMALPAPRTITDVLPRALSLPVFLPLLAGSILAAITGRKTGSAFVQNIQTGLVGVTVFLVVLTFVMMLRKAWTEGRFCALWAYAVGLLAGSHLLHDAMAALGTGSIPPPKGFAMLIQTAVCGLVSFTAGGTPVLLVAISQGWSKATARIIPVWWVGALGQLVLAGITLSLTSASTLYSQHPVAVTGHLLLLFALPLVLLLATRRTRNGRGGPVLSHRFLLFLWPGAVLSGYLGIWLLNRTSMPI